MRVGDVGCDGGAERLERALDTAEDLIGRDHVEAHEVDGHVAEVIRHCAFHLDRNGLAGELAIYDTLSLL